MSGKRLSLGALVVAGVLAGCSAQAGDPATCQQEGIDAGGSPSYGCLPELEEAEREVDRQLREIERADREAERELERELDRINDQLDDIPYDGP